jgi:ferric hydroxamate transport system substrate-binding protein
VSARLNRRQVLFALASACAYPRFATARSTVRVACLDWALAETTLALGHKPIAVVAASDWKRFVIEPPLPAGTVDLGLQQEINLELLARTRPDLILTSPFVQHADVVLRQIAPTLQLSIFEKTASALDQPRALARTLGQRLDRVDNAERFLADAERMFDSYRVRIEALNPLPVMLVNFIDARHVRVYGGAGLYQNVLDRIGLTNAWRGTSNYWGFATVGIERLATDAPLHLIAFEPIPPDAQVTLRNSPLWSRLPFVVAGQVSSLPPAFMFGAMPSALRFARLLVEHIERVHA